MMMMTLMERGQQVVSCCTRLCTARRECVRECFVRRTVIGICNIVKRFLEGCFHHILLGLLPGAYHGRRLEELVAVVSLPANKTLQDHLVGQHLTLGLRLTLVRQLVGEAVNVRLVGAPRIRFLGLVLECDVPLAAPAHSAVIAAILLYGTRLRDHSLSELDDARLDATS